MKLKLQRETLLKPLQMVIGVVERKQTLPILSNVLIKTSDNKLSITGTDLEVELVGQSQLDDALNEDNCVTLPGRKLNDICKALPEAAPIELYQEKQRIILKSGRSRFTLSTLPAADFPSVEEQKAQLSFKMPQAKLKQQLQHTYFSMAQQDVRYYLNGMLWEVATGILHTVATDGHRLAFNSINADIQQTPRIQIIVPRKGILELMRLLSDDDTPVKVTFGLNHLRIEGNDYTFISKLIEGRFPDYDRVIPKNMDKKLLLDRQELRQALQRTAILCNEKFHGVRFVLRKGLLKILANNPEQEVAEEEISIDYSGEDVDIGFNVNYLLDVLNALDGNQVQLTLKDANSSMCIEPPNGKGDCLYVVMPMRL